MCAGHIFELVEMKFQALISPGSGLSRAELKRIPLSCLPLLYQHNNFFLLHRFSIYESDTEKQSTDLFPLKVSGVWTWGGSWEANAESPGQKSP